MDEFKPGDQVRLIERYRTRRLGYNPTDFVANASSVTVEKIFGKDADCLIKVEGSPSSWIASAFERVGGPW